MDITSIRGYCFNERRFKMSNEQLNKSDPLMGASKPGENPRICSFSIERLLAPNKKTEEDSKFLQQTDLSMLIM